MKKIILLLFLISFMSSCEKKLEDPLRYRGSVVVDISPSINYICLKLSPELRDSFGIDYMRIKTHKFELAKLSVGDTIK